MAKQRMMTQYKNSTARIIVLITFILVAGLSRLLPHPPNFTAIGAMALFGGAYFVNRKLAYMVPLLGMLFSDVILEVLFQAGLRPFSGFHPLMGLVYISFYAIVWMGTKLQNRIKPLTLLGAGLASSVFFFIVSNFGEFAIGSYGYSFQGLVACYVAAVPFFHYNLFGDLFYIAILFGGFELVKARFPQLALAENK